jgi:nickel/cobalt exporter
MTLPLDGFSLNLLAGTAAIAVTHTLLGPDHYLPFVMMAHAGRWSRVKTAWVTALCGLGHVASSLLLGALGVLAGVAVHRVEGWESARGDWAAWGLIGLGVAYGLWGLRKGIRQGSGLAAHSHGVVHIHRHGDEEHVHAHGARAHSKTTFWALFAIFVLGPCEPLIPLFLMPASRSRWELAIGLAAVFTVLTVTCMVGTVLAIQGGLARIPLRGLDRWSHAMAGGVIAASGLAIVMLGL